MNPIWHIDEPALIHTDCMGETYRLSGWISSLDPVQDIRVKTTDDNGKPVIDISTHSRDDVVGGLGIPGLKPIGFKGECLYENIQHLDFIEVAFSHRGVEFSFYAPVYRGRAHSIDNKTVTIGKVFPYLRCPVCRTGDIEVKDTTTVRCQECGELFPCENNINFLTPDLREEFNIIDTDNISSNSYDGSIISIINRYHKGLVLDCGSGYRSDYYENVINYEIVPYDSTDIVGVGESLPFKDGTFDAVLSCAVLEHVKDPFLCASELKRVLKKGGTMYCQLPFLQPFHGYPHHYYNATQSGLRNLFEDAIDIEQLDVLDFGQPVALLSWFLSVYMDDLPVLTRKRFANMRVKDFLKPMHEQLTKDYVLKLSDDAKSTLACCNYLVGTKR